jgi:hypothetical protein
MLDGRQLHAMQSWPRCQVVKAMLCWHQPHLLPVMEGDPMPDDAARLLWGPTWEVVGAGGGREALHSKDHTPQGSGFHSLVTSHDHVGCSAHCKDRRHVDVVQLNGWGCGTPTNSPASPCSSAAGAGAGASAAAAQGCRVEQAWLLTAFHHSNHHACAAYKEVGWGSCGLLVVGACDPSCLSRAPASTWHHVWAPVGAVWVIYHVSYQ